MVEMGHRPGLTAEAAEGMARQLPLLEEGMVGDLEVKVHDVWDIQKEPYKVCDLKCVWIAPQVMAFHLLYPPSCVYS